MQRDMKVGMALGLALVGIVGALFFRRDAAPEDPSPPALLGAEEIDQQISEKAKAPYIQGLDEEPGDAPPPPPSNTASTSKPKPKAEDFQVPGFLTKEDEAEHRAFLSGKPASAPDPISPATPDKPGHRETAGVPEPAPAHNRDWEPAGTVSPGAPKDRTPRSTAGAADSGASRRTHTIQPGDTLSSIAGRYLGSSARYREIYEANRHILRSPDDLPEGTQLVIPDGGGRSTVARPVSTHIEDPVGVPRNRPNTDLSRPGRETREPAVSGDFQPGGGLRFAPVRRGPFSAGRTAPGRSGTSEPGAPAEETRPTRRPTPRPQLEIDDSDPF